MRAHNYAQEQYHESGDGIDREDVDLWLACLVALFVKVILLRAGVSSLYDGGVQEVSNPGRLDEHAALCWEA